MTVLALAAAAFRLCPRAHALIRHTSQRLPLPPPQTLPYVQSCAQRQLLLLVKWCRSFAVDGSSTYSIAPPHPELHHSTGTHEPSYRYVEVNHESCVPEREYRVQCVASFPRKTLSRTMIFCRVERMTCCACTTRSSCVTAAGPRGGLSAPTLRRRGIALRSARDVSAAAHHDNHQRSSAHSRRYCLSGRVRRNGDRGVLDAGESTGLGGVVKMCSGFRVWNDNTHDFSQLLPFFQLWAITSPGRRPTFVDLGCGNGFLSHLLRAEG